VNRLLRCSLLIILIMFTQKIHTLKSLRYICYMLHKVTMLILYTYACIYTIYLNLSANIDFDLAFWAT